MTRLGRYVTVARVAILAIALFLATSSAAAITRVQEWTNTATSGVTTLNVTGSATAASGNLLVLIVALEGTAPGANTPTSTGFTRRSLDNNAQSPEGSISIFEKESAGETSVTVNWGTSSRAAIWLIEYSGMNVSSPFDVQASGAGSGATITTATSPSTAQADSLAITGICNNLNRTYSSPTNSFVEVSEFAPGGSFSAVVHERILSSTGTFNHQVTASSTGNWVTAIAIYKGAATATTTPTSTLMTMGVGAP